MKRFLTMLMAASAIFAMNSCKEDTPVEELDGPSVEWPSNSTFATVDITDELDASLTVTAPAGIKSFVVTVDSDALEAALPAIGITTTELDLINDATVTSVLGNLEVPVGDALLNQTSVAFNITSLVQLINSVTTEDSNHSFTLNVTDNNSESATVTCTFHRIGVETPEYDAPTITWESNSDFSVVDITDELDASLTVTAPAGIKSFVVTVDSDALEAALPAIGITTTELDLINDATVTSILGSLGVPVGDALLNQTSVAFNITSLVQLINSVTTEDSNHSFTLNVTDNNSESATATCTFHRIGVETPEYDAPTITWESNSDFSVVDITDELDASLTVTAPAGIKSFVVTVDSDALEATLPAIGITTTELDLINDATVTSILGSLGVPVGDALLNQTSVAFNITSLVQLINSVTTEDSNHSFTLDVTDNNSKSATVTCTFHRVGASTSSSN